MSESAYREQVRVTDGRIGRVLEALQGRAGVRAGREEWLVMVVTDHGGYGTHHTGNLHVQRRVPLIVSGPGVRCSAAPHVAVRVVDVSRTVLTYMGVGEERQRELDGRDLLASCREPAPRAEYGRNLVFNGDGELDRGFADRRFDQAISGWRDQEHTGGADGHHSMTLLRAGPEVRYLAGDGPAQPPGRNLFAGGSKGGSSRMTQVVDVRGLRPAPREGGAEYRIAAYLGAAPGSADRMSFTALFLDERGEVVGSAIVSGGAGDGAGTAPVLTRREASGVVPMGTVAIAFELHAVGPGEGVHSYADLLSFELQPAAAHE
jgi:hypothetical protein